MSKLKGYFYGSVAAATYGLVPLFSLPMMAKNVPFDTILCHRFFISSIVIAGVAIWKTSHILALLLLC